MKKIVILATAFSYQLFSSQNMLSMDTGENTFFRNKVYNSKEEKSIRGIQYLSDKYKGGKIAGYNNEFNFRYNAYKDEVEVLKDGAPFVIAKVPEYSKIIFSDKSELDLLNYEDLKGKKIFGYLYLISPSGLYKKETVVLEKAKEAANPYDTEQPGRYKQISPLYFMKNENDIVEIPNSKKKFLNVVVNKEKALKYLEENKVDFNNEKDLIKLIEAIN